MTSATERQAAVFEARNRERRAADERRANEELTEARKTLDAEARRGRSFSGDVSAATRAQAAELSGGYLEEADD